MKVFLAGASGEIGLPLVRTLADDGHDVTALTRSGDKVTLLRDAGATEVAVGDALDSQAIHAHVRAAQPEVVINQLTAIPADLDLRRYSEQFRATNELRTTGSRILTAAAAAVGARRYLTQSIAFAYEPTDLITPATEDLPLMPNPPDFMADAISALKTTESLAFTNDTDGSPQPFEGVVLRYGFLLGPSSGFRRGGALEKMLRRRQFAVIGGGKARSAMVHVDDAATATSLAMTSPAAAGRTFNVSCDDTLTSKEFANLWAKEIGAPRPLPAPRWLARRIAGDAAVFLTTTVQPASNAAAREVLGWTPRYNTVTRALRHMLDESAAK